MYRTEKYAEYIAQGVVCGMYSTMDGMLKDRWQTRQLNRGNLALVSDLLGCDLNFSDGVTSQIVESGLCTVRVVRAQRTKPELWQVKDATASSK